MQQLRLPGLTAQFTAVCLLFFALALTAFLFRSQISQAACSALPSSKGTATLSTSISSAGSYRVWSRVHTPTANAGRFYLQIADAGACQISVGGGAIPAGTLTWIDYQNGSSSSKIDVTLSAGSHGLVLAGLDDNVAVDRILLLSDKNCVPTGDGSNCTAAATATPTPTPTASSGGGTSTPTLPALPSGSTNIKYYVDGKLVGPTLDTSKLSDGKHTIEVVGTDANGNPVSKKTEVTINKKRSPSFLEQLIAGLRTYGLIVLAGVGVLGVAGFLAYRSGKLPFFKPGPKPLGQPDAPPPSAPPPPAGPAPDLIYPDNSNKDI